MMRTYEYKHVIGFEETNLVSNVYYANYLKWQGRCREMFLRDNAPNIITELSQGLALATVRVSCEYFVELFAFDEVTIQMHLGAIAQNRITMLFEYWHNLNNTAELVARGEQQIACMRRTGEKTIPTPIPEELKKALQLYS